MRTVTLTLSLTLSTHAGSETNSRPLTCGSSMWTEGQPGQHAAFNEWTVINWTHMSQRNRNIKVLIVRPVTVHSLCCATISSFLCFVEDRTDLRSPWNGSYRLVLSQQIKRNVNPWTGWRLLIVCAPASGYAVPRIPFFFSLSGLSGPRSGDQMVGPDKKEKRERSL